MGVIGEGATKEELCSPGSLIGRTLIEARVAQELEKERVRISGERRYELISSRWKIESERG